MINREKYDFRSRETNSRFNGIVKRLTAHFDGVRKILPKRTKGGQ